MTTYIDPASQRRISIGNRVQTSSYTLVVETKTLFTVTGLVLITSLVGRVDTAITVANTVKLQANPTTGATGDLCSATDIGTTDTPAGDLLGLPSAPGSALLFGVGSVRNNVGAQVFVNAGTIEQVTATGADGAVTWFITYVPFTDDGTIAAAF